MVIRYPYIKARRQMERGFVWWELDTTFLGLCESSNSDSKESLDSIKYLDNENPLTKYSFILWGFWPLFSGPWPKTGSLVPENARIILRGISRLVRQVYRWQQSSKLYYRRHHDGKPLERCLLFFGGLYLLSIPPFHFSLLAHPHSEPFLAVIICENTGFLTIKASYRTLQTTPTSFYPIFWL